MTRAAALLLLACGVPNVRASDPMADVERTLFEQGGRARVHVESEGVVAASFDGEIAIDPPAAISMRLRGTFAGEPREPWLELDAERMRGGPREGETAFDVAAPRHAFEAVVIGFARMGLLHNLARLSSGEPPDHAEGGVRAWLVVEGARRMHDEPDRPIRFALIVDGEPSAEGRLVTAGQLPALRELTVHFGEGDMRVVERADWRDQDL